MEGEPERDVTIAPLLIVDGEIRRSDERRIGYAVDTTTPDPLLEPGAEAEGA